MLPWFLGGGWIFFYSISYDWKDGFPKNLASLVFFDYPGGNHINMLHIISL